MLPLMIVILPLMIFITKLGEIKRTLNLKSRDSQTLDNFEE